MTRTHCCTVGQFCGLCAHNVRHGGTANHPSNLKRPKQVQTARKPLAVCAHLGTEPVRVPGSARKWRRCKAGRGSTAAGAEGLVCGCRSPGAGVWRVGVECGEKCPGFTTSSDPALPTPATTERR